MASILAAWGRALGRLVIGFIVVVALFLGIGMTATADAPAHPTPADDSFTICDSDEAGLAKANSAYCKDIENRGGAGGTVSSPILGPNSILYKVIQIVTMVTGAISGIMIIVGGFKYIVSAGDSSATKSAKDTILYAVIGLVITLFAQAIITFVLSSL